MILRFLRFLTNVFFFCVFGHQNITKSSLSCVLTFHLSCPDRAISLPHYSHNETKGSFSRKINKRSTSQRLPQWVVLFPKLKSFHFPLTCIGQDNKKNIGFLKFSLLFWRFQQTFQSVVDLIIRTKLGLPKFVDCRGL